MEKNACNGEERNVVRLRPRIKHTGFFHLQCLHGPERARLFGNNDPSRWGSLIFILNTLVPDHSHCAAPFPFRDSWFPSTFTPASKARSELCRAYYLPSVRPHRRPQILAGTANSTSTLTAGTRVTLN